jgi:hypothetical protein
MPATCSTCPTEVKTVRRKLQVLRDHCDELGRPYDAIDKTLATRLEPTDTSDDLVRRFEQHAKLGISHEIVIRTGPWTPESAELLATVVPQVADL